MWARQYIGLPWVPYATGPEAYDCWGLVHHCLKKHYQINTDRFANVLTNDHQKIHSTAIDELNRAEWVEINDPMEGAVVLMSTRKIWHHIGIYTEGRVLHSRDKVNVALESVARLQQSGMKQFKYVVHESLFINR